MPSLVEKCNKEFQSSKLYCKSKYGPQSSSTPFKEKNIDFEKLDASDISEVANKSTQNGASKTLDNLDDKTYNSESHQVTNYNETSENSSLKNENGKNSQVTCSPKGNSTLKRCSPLSVATDNLSLPVKRQRTRSTSKSSIDDPNDSSTKPTCNENIDSLKTINAQKNLVTKSLDSTECNRKRKISVTSNCSSTLNSIQNSFYNNSPFNDKEVLTLLEDIDSFSNMEDCNISMDNIISAETPTVPGQPKDDTVGKNLQYSTPGNISVQDDSSRETGITSTPTTSMISIRKSPTTVKEPNASMISKAMTVTNQVKIASPTKKKSKKKKYSHKKTPTLSPGKINAKKSQSKSSKGKNNASAKNSGIVKYLDSKKRSSAKEQGNISGSTENLKSSMDAKEYVKVSEKVNTLEKTPKLQSELNKSPTKPGKSFKSKHDNDKSNKFIAKEGGSTTEKDMSIQVSKIEECLRNIKKQERISPAIREKLRKLEIKLQHEVPPQHKIENCSGTRALTSQQRKRFENYIKMNRGAFNTKEDDIVKTNWREFCRIHNWDTNCVEPFMQMRHNNQYLIPSLEQRLKFVQFLSNNLPARSLNSVYQRFKHIFNKKVSTKKSRYSAEEDSKILAYMQYGGDETSQEKFAVLGKVLKKSRQSVWLRYQHLKKQCKLDGSDTDSSDVVARVIWDKPMIEKYITGLLEVTLSKEVKELKDAKIPERVWKELERRLKIDYNTLRRFWYTQLHLQLFCPEPIFLNEVKIKLIAYFHKKKISSIKDIKWPKVLRYFEGMTGVFLCRLFSGLVKTGVRNQEMREILDELYNDKITDLMNEKFDKELPRLHYEDGVIELI